LRPATPGCGPDQRLQVRLDEVRGAPLANLRDVLLALRPREFIVGLRFGAAEGQRVHAIRHCPPHFEECVAADRAAGKQSFVDLEVVQQPASIGRQLFHCDRAFAQFRLPVPTQIGNDQPIPGRQNLSQRQPEAMVQRRGMQKHHAGSLPERGAEELRAVGVIEHCARLF
jgi:hypothetical protein